MSFNEIYIISLMVHTLTIKSNFHLLNYADASWKSIRLARDCMVSDTRASSS